MQKAIIPIIISFIFVIFSLVSMPGTVTQKDKYVHSDNKATPLSLSDVAMPVSLLSFTLCFLLIAIFLIFTSKPKLPVPETP